MAEIYRSQVEHNATETHKFGLAPLQDFISKGMADVSTAAGQVGQMIMVEQDQKAVDTMKLAATDAQTYIDNFEDFNSSNYMEEMVGTAMDKWDTAMNSLAPDVRRRFEANNPKAREIFELKVNEAGVQKTYVHAARESMRQIPIKATEAVNMHDPNAILQAMQAEVENAKNYGLRMEDYEKYIDAYQLAVQQGAIAQAVGEGRADDASMLNNNSRFSTMLTPEQRAHNNKIIQALFKAKEENKKDESEAAINNSVSMFESLYDTFSRVEGPGAAAQRIDDIIDQYAAGKSPADIQIDYAGQRITMGQFLKTLGLAKSDEDIASLMPGLTQVQRQTVRGKVQKSIHDNNPEYEQAATKLNWDMLNVLAEMEDPETGKIDPSSITQDMKDRLEGLSSGIQKYWASLPSEAQKTAERLLAVNYNANKRTTVYGNPAEEYSDESLTKGGWFEGAKQVGGGEAPNLMAAPVMPANAAEAEYIASNNLVFKANGDNNLGIKIQNIQDNLNKGLIDQERADFAIQVETAIANGKYDTPIVIPGSNGRTLSASALNTLAGKDREPALEYSGYNSNHRQYLDDISNNLEYALNLTHGTDDHVRAYNGTYEWVIDRIAAYFYMHKDPEDRAALGISGVSSDAVTSMLNDMRSKYKRVLQEYADLANTTNVYREMDYNPEDDAAIPSIAKSIENSAIYALIKEAILNVNPTANPDEDAVRNLASYFRSGIFSKGPVSEFVQWFGGHGRGADASKPKKGTTEAEAEKKFKRLI